MAVHTVVAALIAALASVVSHAAAPVDANYAAELAQWRAKADENLRRERGWLSMVGRWELDPGRTTIGSAAGQRIVLPKALAPASLGEMVVDGKKARLVLAKGQKMSTVERDTPGTEFTERELCAGDRPLEWVTSGRLSLQLVRRDDGRLVLRAADRDATIRRTFPGRSWYDGNSTYRYPARFVPQPKGTRIPIANVRGEIGYTDLAGQLEFEMDGATVRLDALGDEDGDLFVIFRDATSGSTTYPPGRFLSVARPKDGAWIVDFNKAYNPPCAFSAYTTCPLPPPQNWMQRPVPAGERYIERKS